MSKKAKSTGWQIIIDQIAEMQRKMTSQLWTGILHGSAARKKLL